MSTRYVTAEDRRSPHPVHAVWEITLACDLKCQHCGSRAQKRRPNELTTDECLDVIQQLQRLGCREITLIGGEAYLRQDWTTLVRAIALRGMKPTLQTGARNLTEARIREAAAAGLVACGVSMDGLAPLHDRIRGVPGSHAAAVRALGLLREHGIDTSVNTQLTREIAPQLRDLFAQLVSLGVKNWQLQLTVAMGRAADNDALLLQPYQLGELMPLLFELYQEGLRKGLLLQPGNNVGYFGPYESAWRGTSRDGVHWIGCNAGQNTLGIEADGTIKGCPSLPTASYAGGNVRDLSLERIWNESPELAFTRDRSVDDLWGYCKGCYFADVCRGGCSWTSHTLLGKPGNNPFCHYRVLELEKRGLRERVAKVAAAEGKPFDHGRFELQVERIEDGALVERVSLETPESRLSAPAGTPHRHEGEGPPKLVVCRACKHFVWPDEVTCPHCSADVAASEEAYQRRLSTALEALVRLESALEQSAAPAAP